MAYDELTTFLEEADDHGELVRIEASVDPMLEVSAVTAALSGHLPSVPIAFFDRVGVGHFPLVTNLLASRSRLLRATGAESFRDVAHRVLAACNPFTKPQDWSKTFTSGSATVDRLHFTPRWIKRGACQQVVKVGRDVDLQEFPCPTLSSGETAPSLTATHVSFAVAPEEVLHRRLTAFVSGPQTLSLVLAEHDDLWRHLQRARRQQKPVPVAISLGGDPLLPYVANLSLPVQFDVWTVAGMLRGTNLNLIKGHSVPLSVPADAELVLEGVIDAQSESAACVVANEQGCLTERNDLPQVHLTAVTHRANPILPVLLNSLQSPELLVWSELTAELMKCVLQLFVPGLVDLHFPDWGRNSAIVVSVEGESACRSQLVAALESLPLLRPNLIIIVSAATDVRDMPTVWGDALHAIGQEKQHVERGRIVIDATGADAARKPFPAEVVSRLQELGLDRLTETVKR